MGSASTRNEHIFDLFSRLRELKGVEGIGVGLAVVKRVVQTYGGNVWLESEKGKGTTVFVSIPDYARS
jgi:chemotaxis family two-component system sensor kinase Cph1